jgi:hypothetical protein
MQFKTILLAAFAGLLGGLLGSYLGRPSSVLAQPAVPDRITAHEIDLVDSSGNTLLTIDQNKGVPEIVMQSAPHANPSGKARVDITGILVSDSQANAADATAGFGIDGVTITHPQPGGSANMLKLRASAPSIFLENQRSNGAGSNSAEMATDRIQFSRDGNVVCTLPSGTPCH